LVIIRLKSFLLYSLLRSNLFDKSSNKVLQVLDLSYNKLDDNSIWELLEAIKQNSSLLKLYLIQERKVSELRLIYQICEVLINNKTLKELYLEAVIPERIVDKMLTALNTNLSLIVWDTPGNLRLAKSIEANRIIKEKNMKVDVEEYPELKEILKGKLKTLEVKQQITNKSFDKASEILKQELKRTNGKIEATELTKILIEIFIHNEITHEQERTKLENRIEKLEKSNLKLEESKKEINVPLTITRRIQSLEDGLNSYITALEDVRNEIKRAKALEYEIEKVKKDMNKLYEIVEDTNKRVKNLQESFKCIGYDKEVKVGSEYIMNELESINKKQMYLQHKVKELEKIIDDSNKLHRMSIENLSLGIKNVELSKSLTLLENKGVSKSFNAKEPSKIDNSPPYLSRKYMTIQETKIGDEKSINPITVLENSGNENKTILKLRYSPDVRNRPSKELMESLRNKGFEFDF